MTGGLPVTVIGGYLGSGKTTLVNRLLRHAGGRRLAVMVNDFGALPIDRDLIESQDGDVIAIAGGCVCCTFGADLTESMARLITRDPPPDQILVEASGIAMPGMIAATLSLLPGIDLLGVVVLADAETIVAQGGDAYVGDTICRQLEQADLVLLTKPDLAGAAGVAAARDWIAAAGRRVPVAVAREGMVPPELVLGAVARAGALPEPLPGGHAFESVVLRPDTARTPEGLAEALTSPDLGVIRAKGALRDPSGGMAMLQLVGRRWRVTPAPFDAVPGIVCIGVAGLFSREALARLGKTD